MSDKFAVVFPGQGCQFVGMGADLQAFPLAREMYRRADEVLGFELSRLCFEGPEEALNDTANTQPAVYVTSMVLWALLEPQIEPLRSRIACVAGHSLGEFSALTMAGAITFEEGVRLVRRRGEAMRDAGRASPGGMAAIIGLDDAVVEEIVAQVAADGGDVWVANYNSPGQIIIAGAQAALAQAMEMAKERGAKRALPLQVSVACHTPLMSAASERLAVALEETTFRQPWVPVVSNALAEPLSTPAEIKAALLRQLNSPVLWTASVQRMARDGVGTALEIGPKSVVAGLIKRIERNMIVQAVTDKASLEAFDATILELGA